MTAGTCTLAEEEELESNILHLELAGEQSYPVPSLSLPEPGRETETEAVEQSEAVHFFASDLSSKSTGNFLNVDAGNAVSFTR